MSGGNSQPPFRSDGALLTASLFQGNELEIEFRVFQFGSSKARRLGIVIASVAIIFLILVLMFGRG